MCPMFDEYTTLEEDMLADIEADSVYFNRKNAEEEDEYKETGKEPVKWGRDDVDDGEDD